MPILSMFYGIVIGMYFNDDRQHHVPHLHADYAGQRAVFNITNGQCRQGNYRGQGPTGSGVDRNTSRRAAG